jgi:hypothetical protein
MTIDELERMAREAVAFADPHCFEFAIALLAMLPVVRAAEAWRIGKVDAPPIVLCDKDLMYAVDEFRRVMGVP